MSSKAKPEEKTMNTSTAQVTNAEMCNHTMLTSVFEMTKTKTLGNFRRYDAVVGEVLESCVSQSKPRWIKVYIICDICIVFVCCIFIALKCTKRLFEHAPASAFLP